MICLRIYYLCRLQERHLCIQSSQCVHMTSLLVQKELFIRSFRITVVCLYRSGKIGAITYGLPQRTPMCQPELNTFTLQPAVIIPEEP